jgi:ring-1,2-phenylacetyl-CoA epoxidase subunit PaaD
VVTGRHSAAGESAAAAGFAEIRRAASADEHAVWSILETVLDPEIPVLSVVDLGIIRYVRWQTDEAGQAVLHVGITPTYSGCPATEVIEQSIADTLREHGYSALQIDAVLAPPWSSDWLSQAGRQKLVRFGIAPPMQAVGSLRELCGVSCPRCGSRHTECLSEFGSTPCKAHYRCRACLEPFDHFKCL